MDVIRRGAAGLVIAAVLSSSAGAHDAEASPAATPPPVVAANAGTPAAAVEAFQSALVNGDRDSALSWLDPAIVIFESGGAEMSREEYAAHHLDSDLAFLAATKHDVLDRQVQSAGETAWVLSRTRTTGRFRDRPIDVDGVETMVLRRLNGDWRIVHIHWSSHARQAK
jgi:ketosteroid isomerase-like protein